MKNLIDKIDIKHPEIRNKIYLYYLSKTLEGLIQKACIAYDNNDHDAAIGMNEAINRTREMLEKYTLTSGDANNKFKNMINNGSLQLDNRSFHELSALRWVATGDLWIDRLNFFSKRQQSPHHNRFN